MFEVFTFNVDGKVVHKKKDALALSDTYFNILFIFTLNSTGERMLSCRTPFS